MESPHNREQRQPYGSNRGNTAEDLGRFVEGGGAQNMGCCLDIGGMAVVGDSIDDCYRALPNRVKHVHFSDRNHEIPGDQDLPLGNYISQLNAKGYDGYLTLEVNDGIYAMDPHSAFMRSADYMRKLLGQ